MKTTYKLFAFDFDGTLVDSYSCLPEIYRSVAVRVGISLEKIYEFVKKAIEYEDLYDYLGEFDRRAWWSDLFAEFGVNIEDKVLEEIVRDFWEMRAKKSVIVENCMDVLETLKSKGFILAIVAGNDGLKSVKKKRVEKSGLAKHFDDIIIVGEDVSTHVEALKFLAKKYELNFDEMVYVDDKPSPINMIKSKLEKVTTIRVKFSGILKLAWREKCYSDFVIERMSDLLKIL